VPAALDIVTTVMRTKKTESEGGDDRGLSAWAFAALILGAFAIVAVCALVGGWAGLTGIVVTAVALIVLAVARL
jgi:hypothetical protein